MELGALSGEGRGLWTKQNGRSGNGAEVLSGLVACTALCDVATPTSSIVIGLLSGLVVGN
jgi:ammonia channel protein AmtB